MNPISHDLADADQVGLVAWVETYTVAGSFRC
jgi:hypothetical protein